MGKYVLPMYITAKERDKAGYTFSARHMRADAPAPRMPTCGRCLQNIARKGGVCNKPEEHRCPVCVKDHRQRYTVVSFYRIWSGSRRR